MAHFAKVLDGIVQNIIVAEPEFFENFIDSSPGEWIQTSYYTRGGVHYTSDEEGNRTVSEDQSKALRYNFASIGGSYDKDADAFIPPKPFPSWVLNTDTYRWEPPVEAPTEGGPFAWNEETQSWDAVETE